MIIGIMLLMTDVTAKYYALKFSTEKSIRYCCVILFIIMNINILHHTTKQQQRHNKKTDLLRKTTTGANFVV